MAFSYLKLNVYRALARLGIPSTAEEVKDSVNTYNPRAFRYTVLTVERELEDGVAAGEVDVSRVSGQYAKYSLRHQVTLFLVVRFRNY